MSKLTLSHVANLTNENSAVSTMNANFDATVTALDNTLSRDGTSPNQMNADFDMNSHRILNLPAPVLSTDVVRLQELSTITGGGIVSNIPTGGATGAVLAKNSTTNYDFGWTTALNITTVNKITLTPPATGATLTLIDGTTVTGPAASGTIMTLGNAETVTGAKSFNSGTVIYKGATSGTITLNATATAGSNTLTLPAATDTLVGKATTDTLTNKTFNTAGTGNVFQINGTGITAVTGSGSVVLNTNPTLVTPNIGTPSAGTLTNCTGLPVSGHAAIGAYTFVGNNTGGSASPTAVDIAALTTKASPAGSDYLILSDQAASGAWKKATVTSVAAGATVASINTATGAITTGLSAVQNASLAVSAAASALTITLNDAAGSTPSGSSAVVGLFRSATGTTGTYSALSVTSATSLVISSGSTLGVASSTAFRLWVVLFNDAGTARLGVINCASGQTIYPLAEHILATSTAEGGAGAADNAGTFYTGTAVTSKPYCILGFLEWNSTGLTAGTWTTTNLSLVQAFGPGIKKPGDVLQRQTATTTTQFNTTSAGYQATNLTMTFTPTSAANRVFVQYMGVLYNRSSGGESAYSQLYRGSTAIGPVSETYSSTNPTVIPVSGHTLDSPNSAAGTVYAVRIRNGSGVAQMGFPDGATTPAELECSEIMV